MKTITISLFGDYWLNPQEVEQQIRALPVDQPLQLDFQAEGVSVRASGIHQRLWDICQLTGRSPSSIRLINNPNVWEITPFENVNLTDHLRVTSLTHQKFRSHFLSGDLPRSYWQDPVPVDADARLFGLFIGRRTVARDVILRQCQTRPHRFLFSLMRNVSGIQRHDEAELASWMRPDEIDAFQAWRQSVDIPSLDRKSTRDQYKRLQPNTNRSLLDFYPQFQIEIVPETYTLGDTFFPTEKTARPLTAAKPILVYGPRNFLARLRDLYGYQTWSDHWDEGYDQLEGPARWQAMWRAMEDITPDTVNEPVQTIAQHNREIMRKMMERQL